MLIRFILLSSDPVPLLGTVLLLPPWYRKSENPQKSGFAGFQRSWRSGRLSGCLGDIRGFNKLTEKVLDDFVVWDTISASKTGPSRLVTGPCFCRSHHQQMASIFNARSEDLTRSTPISMVLFHIYKKKS